MNCIRDTSMNEAGKVFVLMDRTVWGRTQANIRQFIVE